MRICTSGAMCHISEISISALTLQHPASQCHHKNRSSKKKEKLTGSAFRRKIMLKKISHERGPQWGPKRARGARQKGFKIEAILARARGAPRALYIIMSLHMPCIYGPHHMNSLVHWSILSSALHSRHVRGNRCII